MNKRIYMLIVLGFIFTLMGGTFAWYSWQSSESDRTAVVFTTTSGFSCSGDGGGNITGDAMLAPVSSCASETNILKKVITLDVDTTTDIELNLWLNVLNIDSEILTSDAFRYTLVPHDTPCTSGVERTIKNSINNNKIYLISNKKYTTDSTNQYDLYIWIDGPTSTNDDMDRQFNLSLGGICTNLTNNLTENDAMFDTGPNVNVKMKKLAGDTIQATDPHKTTDTKITAISKSNTAPTANNMTEANLVSVSSTPIYMWYDTGVIYWWSSDNTPSLNSDASHMFRSMSNLTDISGLQYMDASTATLFLATFGNLSNITDYSPISNWNTSNVTNMSYMFQFNTSLTNVDALSNWDTSNVNNMEGNFFRCANLSNIDVLSNWDTSNVTNMQWMFSECISLSNINALSNWNTSNVTEMCGMFANCLLTNLNALSKWDTGNVENMQQMFMITDSFYNNGVRDNLNDITGLRNWNTSKVTNMRGMFANRVSLNDISALSNWDTSNVTIMYTMFKRTNLSDISSLSNWDVSNVTEFGNTGYNAGAGMFANCTNLTDASAINNWNIRSDADFTGMFNGAPSHPEFTKVAGTWNSNGTFIPTTGS